MPQPRIDETRAFVPVRIAVLTVSDTRDETNDTSGDTLEARIKEARHIVAARLILRDDGRRSPHNCATGSPIRTSTW